MMLTIDVYLLRNCFCLKSFICITHCVTLIPSCYIALSYLFAKVQIANKFLMSLFNPPLPPLKNPAYATGPGHMGPGQMGPRQMGPRQMGPRTNKSLDK